MRLVGWLRHLALASLVACGSTSHSGNAPDASTPPTDTTPPPVPTEPPPTPPPSEPADVDLQIVFVHGVTAQDSGRKVAHEQLIDLEKGIVEHVAARGDTHLHVASTRVNLYTDETGELVTPRIDDLEDGTGNPTANAWRAQLIKKTNAVFPNAKHIVYVGHSTGGRVVAEVGASEEMRDRVVGVVTVHGMIDALQTTKYNLQGPTSYITACKVIEGDGWCDYSGLVSATEPLDWLARERHVLSLVGAASCSPSYWGGVNDQSLPLQAQSSPWSPGIQLTPAPNRTYAPAHGVFYGEFCHGDVVDGRRPTHAAAVNAVSEQFVTWLFDAAPRVVATESPEVPVEVAPLEADTLSAPIALAGPCPAKRHSNGKVDIAGLCRHPGNNDGNDHPFDAANEVELDIGAQCDATIRVAHHHAGDAHAMRVWTKRYSLPEGGGLLSTLR